MENKFLGNRIYCIASGEAEGVLKFYMYAQDASTKAEFLIELQIVKATKILDATIKSTKPEIAEKFKIMYESIIKSGLN